MRFKQHFTLYPRQTKGGIIWYYRTYDEEGRRTAGTSTGMKSKAKAQAFCEQLFADGGLLCSETKDKNLSDFITGFFDEDSIFMRDKLSQGTDDCPAISKATIKKYRNNLNLHILPFFKNVKVKNLTPTKIKEFRETLIEKKLARKTINGITQTFNIIIKSLLNDSILENDPMKGIQALKNNSEKIGAFTLREAQIILNSEKWEKEESRLAALVCCMTGMRINEVLAINKNELKTNVIDCQFQCETSGKKGIVLKNTKTKVPRIVPICSELEKLLKANIKEDGFIFHISEAVCYKDLRKLMTAEHLDGVREERHLRQHSWRHFYNTYLLANNVNEVKVDAVIGHSREKGSMQKIYTNWTIEHFQEVIDANNQLWGELFSC